MRLIKVCPKPNVQFWTAEKSPFISCYKIMFIHMQYYCLLNTTYFFRILQLPFQYHYFYFSVRESSKLNNISAVHYQI